MTWPSPPSSWEELTREQLIHINSMEGADPSNILFKLKVFLYLCGLELCSESFFNEPEQKDEESEEKQMERNLQWMEDMLSGQADITVVLRQTGVDDGPLYSIPATDLFDAVTAAMKFMEEPMGLIDNKLGTIEIESEVTDSDGKIHKYSHSFKAPDILISNLTYEQYQNAQNSLSSYWYYAQESQQLFQTAQQKEKELSKGKKSQEKIEEGVRELQKQIEQTMDSVRESQADFCSHVLTSDHPRIEEQAVEYGSFLRRRKKTVSVLRHDYTYNSTEAIEHAKMLKASMPVWLFPILNQQFQSSLAEYKKKFKDLFSGVAGESNDQFKAMLSTINSVKKEYGFDKNEDVLATNAVFIFDMLDTMVKHAKEMEKLNAKMSKKR